MLRLASVVLLAAGAVMPALAAESLPRGQVLESLVSLQDPSYACALYLPSAYDPGRRWPIVYAFDPGGRGILPVSLFQEAAEKFGWIVAASNNSRNGPWKDIIQAAWALWDDTHARLRIDDARVYAAGFSGGARVASGLARILEKQTAGVIACGGGLAEWLEPADVAATPWFGTAGSKDFNLKEMRALEKSLRRQQTPCRLSVFKGSHSWPPAELAMEAIAWLEGLHAASAPQQGGEEDMAIFTMGEEGESVIRAVVGKTFVIRFAANPGTGYNWELAGELDEKLLSFLGETMEEPQSGLVGGRETFRWTFRTLAPGATEIAMNYARPWEKGAAPLKKYAFKVLIEP